MPEILAQAREEKSFEPSSHVIMRLTERAHDATLTIELTNLTADTNEVSLCAFG